MMYKKDLNMNDVLPQLIEMTRYLANPAKGFAILGEGNTSARIDDDTFYVKASGTSMVRVPPLNSVAIR